MSIFRLYTLVSIFVFVCSIYGNQTIAARKPIVCTNTYALCNAAACHKIPGLINRVLCKCSIWHGKNIGYSSCQQRKPKMASLDTTKLISTFSFGGEHYKLMTCSHGPWASCLDQPCYVDKHSPSQRRAYCNCLLKKPSQFVTYAGNCQTKYCRRAIWSGATITGNNILSQQLAKSLKQPQTLKNVCPKK